MWSACDMSSKSEGEDGLQKVNISDELTEFFLLCYSTCSV